MNKLKISCGILNGYCGCCKLISQLMECLVETILVLLCIPFIPILCMFAACEEKAETEELDKLIQL